MPQRDWLALLVTLDSTEDVSSETGWADLYFIEPTISVNQAEPLGLRADDSREIESASVDYVIGAVIAITIYQFNSGHDLSSPWLPASDHHVDEPELNSFMNTDRAGTDSFTESGCLLPIPPFRRYSAKQTGGMRRKGDKVLAAFIPPDLLPIGRRNEWGLFLKAE